MSIVSVQIPYNTRIIPIRGIRTHVEVTLGTKTYKKDDEKRVTAKQSAQIEALLNTKYCFKQLPEELQPYSIPTLGKTILLLYIGFTYYTLGCCGIVNLLVTVTSTCELQIQKWAQLFFKFYYWPHSMGISLGVSGILYFLCLGVFQSSSVFLSMFPR